jgi:opacity protein-like surface antigen
MYRKLLPLAIFAGAFVVPGSLGAQAHYDTRYGGSTPNFELYGGYSYVFRTFNPTSNSVAFAGRNGWDASFKVPIFGVGLGIKGDVSGSYLNDDLDPNLNVKSLTFLLGPQVGVHLGRSTLFAHGMVGSAHLSEKPLPNLRSDTTFAVAVGAGLDVGISRNFAWRITGDYFNTHYHATDQNIREILNSNGRVSTGPVLRF